MGYRGKWRERERARDLRAQAWTLQAIADELGVSKASVSAWVRDVEFSPRPRARACGPPRPHPMHLAKLAEIEACRAEARRWVGELSDRDLAMFALALYAGEGSKTDGSIVFANSDPVLMRLFVSWLRREFDLDESRLRVKLYLHADLDLNRAVSFWSGVLGVPVEQFTKPYRAVVDATMRHNRHVHGCASVVYHSRSLHRRVMARIAAVGSSVDLPG